MSKLLLLRVALLTFCAVGYIWVNQRTRKQIENMPPPMKPSGFRLLYSWIAVLLWPFFALVGTFAISDTSFFLGPFIGATFNILLFSTGCRGVLEARRYNQTINARRT